MTYRPALPRGRAPDRPPSGGHTIRGRRCRPPGAGHEVHLPLGGLLPLREGPMHRPGLFDHPVAEAPGGDAFPPAGPPVVPAGLFDARTLNDREEVEDPEARTVRFNPRPLRVREELPDPVVAEIEETGRNLEPELHHVPV